MDKKISIVIADDHLLIAETWATLINMDPSFNVLKIFNNTETLLQEINKLNPDVALLDINIPPISGLEAVPLLKEKSPMTRIIGVSMHTKPTFAKRMLENGAMGYVTKNSGKDEMYTAIQEVMKGNVYVCQEIRDNQTMEMQEGLEDANKLNKLTGREMGIIQLLTKGYSDEEIATELVISTQKVSSIINNMLKKLELNNRPALIRLINKFFPDI